MLNKTSSRHRLPALAGLMAIACALSTPAAQAVTLTKVSSTEWAVSNGILSFSINPAKFDISKLKTTINGVTTSWMDTNARSPFGHAVGFYNLYSYTNIGTVKGAVTADYRLENGYLDVWVNKPNVPGSDPLGVENHWVIRDGDPTIHFYQVLRHTANDGATSFGAATVNFFPSPNAVSKSDGSSSIYMKNTGPNNMTVVTESFPSDAFSTSLVAGEPGRQVQAETVDYTATTLGTHLQSPGLTREFITKYNYSTYAEYHVAHGAVGPQSAFWWVVPSPETLHGGPTKQFLTTVQMEYESGHLGGKDVSFAAGEVATRLFGPYALRFNAFDSTRTTADALYNDAAGSVESYLSFYDNESVLLANGYTARANRGSVQATIAGDVWSTDPGKNVVVLSDNNTNFQESSKGYQYWGYADSTGRVTIPNVRPGTYRLSAFVRGEWGLYHIDNVTVGTGASTVSGTFNKRRFSTANPVWKIGIADRSAGEFWHGHDTAGHDVRDYIGATNYWKDLEPNQGKVVYTVGSSNYQTGWPVTQYGKFYPNLFAGVYGGSATATNGYDYITPQYVKDGAAVQGKTPANYTPPAWEVHFKPTAVQLSQGRYVLVSINLAANNTSSLQVRLNGKHSAPLLWYPRLNSNPEQRSGVAGYNNYAVFQFDIADLNPLGTDNVLTLFASGATTYDALKLEIGNQDANPATRGWPEYDWLYYNASGTRTSQAASAP